MLSDVYKIFLHCFLASCGLNIYSNGFWISTIIAKEQINLVSSQSLVIPNSNAEGIQCFSLISNH